MKQTVKQRKKLGTGSRKTRSRSPATTPGATLPSERHYDYAEGYRDGYEMAETAAQLRVLAAAGDKATAYRKVAEYEAEGLPEALPEAPKARRHSILSRLKAFLT